MRFALPNDEAAKVAFAARSMKIHRADVMRVQSNHPSQS
jgi:hypothetical protein